MTVPVIISIFGACSAIIVSIIGAWLANNNNIILQTRKLKEEHYVAYMESLHNLASDNASKELIKKYVLARDKLFLVGSEDVVKKILLYEAKVAGKENNEHDRYLTELIKAIRKDLKLVDKSFPEVHLRK